eukprot:s1900_g1.t1
MNKKNKFDQGLDGYIRSYHGALVFKRLATYILECGYTAEEFKAHFAVDDTLRRKIRRETATEEEYAHELAVANLQEQSRFMRRFIAGAYGVNAVRRRSRRTWHGLRRSRRCRSLSLAKAPPKVRLSTPPTPASIEPTPPAAQELPQLPAQVAEAYGHEFFQSYWDWPLSRLEKKMRLLELDRELMKVEREELAGELQEARRMSWS